MAGEQLALYKVSDVTVILVAYILVRKKKTVKENVDINNYLYVLVHLWKLAYSDLFDISKQTSYLMLITELLSMNVFHADSRWYFSYHEMELALHALPTTDRSSVIDRIVK